MPEENEVVEGEVQDGTEGSSEVEAKEEPRVPVHVVKELRDELRESKKQAAELQKMAMQYAAMLQQNNQQPKQVQPEPETDPEIAKLLRPYIAPIQKELDEAKIALQQFGQTKTQLEAERYIERNLPNLDEIRQDMIKEIESLPDNEKEEVLNNPREIVRIGKYITRMKSGTSTAKSDMRSRAKAETGAGAPTQRSETADPTNLSQKEFNAYLRENGWFD